MQTLSSTSLFDQQSLSRFLKKRSIARAVITLKILFVFVVLALFVNLAAVVLEEYLGVQSTLDELTTRIAKIQPSATGEVANVLQEDSYQEIYEKSIFGELKKASPLQPKPEPKKSATALSLIGTFVSGSTSEAIIENTKSKSQDVFSIGDQIFDEAKLVAVYSNKVEIEREGKIEILAIDDSSDVFGGVGGGSTGSDEDFTVDEGELNTALENLPLLLTQARAVPYFKDGKAVGLRLFAIKNGSLYEKVGLKNGDILKELNGSSLGDISQAMKLFERLKEERQITLTLERNRVKKVFNYRIQ
jgi:general secretion pathway protein C